MSATMYNLHNNTPKPLCQFIGITLKPGGYFIERLIL